jgi:predicted ester cyclase
LQTAGEDAVNDVAQEALAIVGAMGAAELTSLDELRQALHPQFECWLGAARDPIGRDAYVESIAQIREALPDLEYEVPAPPVADGNRVATTYRIVGTHSGPYFDFPPTGARIDVAGLSMFEVEDGSVRRMWSAFDTLALVTQLEVS